MRDVNVLLVGVGGQGVVLASDAMAEVGMLNGYDVKKSDSLGMAQRGGSVVSHVRWGRRVFSPMVKRGEADFLLAFEQLEGARWAPYLRDGGVAVVADVVVVPVSVIGSTTPYPTWDEIERTLCRYTDQVYRLPAMKIGLELGNPRALNMVMLGFLSAFLELEAEAWTGNIRRHLPPKFVESSLAAFDRGAAEALAMKKEKGVQR
ncbi:MAG: indolepyruvate oxidoreductase subunit beta [Chloroflexota bacterium]